MQPLVSTSYRVLPSKKEMLADLVDGWTRWIKRRFHHLTYTHTVYGNKLILKITSKFGQVVRGLRKWLGKGYLYKGALYLDFPMPRL